MPTYPVYSSWVDFVCYQNYLQLANASTTLQFSGNWLYVLLASLHLYKYKSSNPFTFHKEHIKGSAAPPPEYYTAMHLALQCILVYPLVRHLKTMYIATRI